MTTETDWMWVYENPKEAAAEINRLREALRAFTIHATYPVSKEINPRGYAWRGEEALDHAMSVARTVAGIVD